VRARPDASEATASSTQARRANLPRGAVAAAVIEHEHEHEEQIMSLFGKILEKLGLGKAEAAPAPAPHPAPASSTPASAARPAAPPPPKPIAVVDVVAQLEKAAAAHPQKLNWKRSIVDLLKLLGIENSYAARKDLARELGCPEELMHDSAQMNMWLHKTVLKKIADNGGNVPSELLD